MINFLKKQFEKEKNATKKVFKWYLNYLVIFWGVIGLILLFSPGWPMGLIFVVSAAYIIYRKKQK